VICSGGTVAACRSAGPVPSSRIRHFFKTVQLYPGSFHLMGPSRTILPVIPLT
jgi:hypothetical protein